MDEFVSTLRERLFKVEGFVGNSYASATVFIILGTDSEPVFLFMYLFLSKVLDCIEAGDDIEKGFWYKCRTAIGTIFGDYDNLDFKATGYFVSA